MFPALAKTILDRNLNKLFANDVALETPGGTTMTVTSGVPTESQTFSTHWSGKGSIQYVRPRIQKSFADEVGGTMEDQVGAVAYIPYDANPQADMLIVDVDGVLGDAGAKYVQSREPADVGGAHVYWECYIGKQVNA